VVVIACPDALGQATLTEGRPHVTDVVALRATEGELLPIG
jgi:hypothetical protein